MIIDACSDELVLGGTGGSDGFEHHLHGVEVIHIYVADVEVVL